MAKKDKGKKKDKEQDVPNGQLKDGELKTPIFRAGWVGLPDEDGKYSVTAIFDDETNLKELEKLALKTLRDEHGKDAEFGEDYKSPWNKGDKRAKKKGQPEYENTMYCNIGTNFPIEVVDAKGNSIALDEDSELYAGAYFRAVINAYCWDNSGKEGVSFGLQALQKIRDGKKISGGGMSPERARSLFDDGVAETESKKGKDKDKKKKKKKK